MHLHVADAFPAVLLGEDLLRYRVLHFHSLLASTLSDLLNALPAYNAHEASECANPDTTPTAAPRIVTEAAISNNTEQGTNVVWSQGAPSCKGNFTSVMLCSPQFAWPSFS